MPSSWIVSNKEHCCREQIDPRIPVLYADTQLHTKFNIGIVFAPSPDLNYARFKKRSWIHSNLRSFPAFSGIFQYNHCH